MQRVLQISSCNSLRGVEKQELEIFNNISKKIVFDFLTPNKEPFKNHQEEIIKNGGKLYDFNIKRKTKVSKIIYAYKLYKFLKKHNYQIIHINSSAFFFSFHVAIIARMCKVKKIIAHSHSVRDINIFKRFIIYLLKPIFFRITTEHLSCSNKAKISLYKNKYPVKIINNGIDINKYKFKMDVRNEYRTKLNLKNKIVYGHIGNFDYRKNQSFLIDIFYEIQKKQENSLLILIGDGILKRKIEAKVKDLKIEDKVIFMGFINNVDEIINSIDVLIFPSIKEGLGIVTIESQTNGLMTYCSNNISNEANISPYFKSFNLSDLPSNIADSIINEKKDYKKRENAYKYTKKNKYDIKDSCRELEKIYLGD